MKEILFLARSDSCQNEFMGFLSELEKEKIIEFDLLFGCVT